MKVVATLACLALSASADDHAWTAHVTVRFLTAGDAHRAEVETVLKWNRGRGSWPDAVELRISDGLGGFVHGVAVEGDRATLPVPDDGDVAYAYTVALDHDPEAMSGYDETPHALSDAVLWTGRALFLLPADADARIVFEPMDGEHVSTSLPPLEEEHAYHAPSAFDAGETYLVVGRHEERVLELDGSTFVLAVDGRLAEASDLLESAARDFVAAASATAGGPPPPRCLVAVTWAEHEGGGSVYGHDAHVLANEPPTADGRKDWRRTLCHELFHLWNPKRIAFDSREMWFSEGFTDYYANRILFTTGELTPAEFRKIVADWAGDYLGVAPGKSLREGGKRDAKERALIYQGGALAALCLDIELRRQSKNKRGLDEVLQTLYEQCMRDGGFHPAEVPIGTLGKLLEKHGDRNLGKFLERHVDGAEPLPLAESFAHAGLLLEQETLVVPERDALVPLLQCSGMTIQPDGIEINRTDSGKLKVDDLLVELDGVPVRGWDDLGWALAGHEPGDKLPAAVLRKGKRVAIELRLGGHGQELPRTERQRTRLEPDPKAKKPARTIREALFG